MRTGISISSAHPGEHRDGPRFMIERAAAAARAGLDVLSIGDHHATGPVPYVQNVPVLARMLAEWDERPAGCLFLVPLWHPVLMAEQIGTLAAMARGPFVVQTGLGAGHQVGAMGVDPRERAVRLEEGIALVRALLDGETVSSERWGVRDATVAPLPERGVQWWIGGSSRRALERVARIGDSWYVDAGVTLTTAAEQMAIVQHACADHGTELSTIAVRKDVLVSEDGTEAQRLGDQLIGSGYRGMPRDAVAYGSPEQVAEQLAPYAELGCTHVMIRTMAVPQEVALRSIELMGEVGRLLAERS